MVLVTVVNFNKKLSGIMNLKRMLGFWREQSLLCTRSRAWWWLWKQAKRVECHGSVNNFCWTSFWADSIELVSTKKYGQGRMVPGRFLLVIKGRIAFFILSLSPCYFHQLLLSFYLSTLFSFWARWICGLFHRTLSIIWNL